MPKNIVLLSDGTGNSAAKLAKTNVWRLYQSLDLSNPEAQIATYDDGVGTSSFKPLAIIGGAFGYGLKRNVLHLYTFLCRNYKAGDQIYCFGFSRGAFTVRTLVGLIDSEGIVACGGEADLQKQAKTAYRNFRRKHCNAVLPFDRIGRAIRDLFVGSKEYDPSKHQKPRIAFLGVWDTVAAYGLPIDELTRALNWVWRLYWDNRKPCSAVNRICHAVAIDDERNTFHPMLFDEEGIEKLEATNIHQEVVSQVWFTGMHSNVGGGYPDDGLASVSLEWMLCEAHLNGLRLRPNIALNSKALPDEAKELLLLPNAGPPGKLYDSRRGLGGLYRYLPRKIEGLTSPSGDKASRVVIQRPKIHESVFQRIVVGVDCYAPIVFPKHYAVVRKNGDIVDSASVLEHPTQALDRVYKQEKIWDDVWKKRVAYFSSIIIASFLVTFPVWARATEACESPFCIVSPLIRWIGALLPDFLAPWLTAYQSNPGWFLLLAASFVFLLKKGDKIQQRILDGMRDLWKKSIADPRKECKPVGKPTNSLYRFRTHDVYRWIFLQLKMHILPALFGTAAAIALFGIASRLLFLSIASAGGVCSDPGASGSNLIEISSPCSAIYTSQPLKQGQKYRIHLTIQKPYQDNTITAGLGGLERTTWAHIAGFFFRRRTTETWFKPIARIGKTGIDEYVLSPEDGTAADHTTVEMSSTITARRSGQLYLFLNDAVLPIPAVVYRPAIQGNILDIFKADKKISDVLRWEPIMLDILKPLQRFYRNNVGRISVDVQPLVTNDNVKSLASN